MISFMKRLLLYFYILATRYRQRYKIISKLLLKARPQRDVAFEKPTLPDLVDDIHDLPDGWSEIHAFSAFDRNGTGFVCKNSFVNGWKRELFINITTEGSFAYVEDEDEKNTDNGLFIKKQRLKCNVIDPMTKWEISYRGHMKSTTNNEESSQRKFVRFHLYWKGYRDPHDYWLTIHAWQLAFQCSKLPLSESFALLSSKSLWFEQWGELRGTIQVEDREYKFRMPSCRERKFIPKESKELSFSHISTHYIEIDGLAHKYAHKTLETKDGCKLYFGHVLFPSLEAYATKLKTIRDREILFHFCGREVRALELLRRNVIHTKDAVIDYKKFKLDERPSFGLAYVTTCSFNQKDGKSQIERQTLQKGDFKEDGEEKNVVEVSDDFCNSPALVGSKAANLNALMKFGVAVPPAICITTKVFHRILQPNEKLAEAVKYILDIIREKKIERLKEACDYASQQFANCVIDPYLLDQILEQVLKLTSVEERGVAIRSSAIGDDGEVLSAAGQLETILSVRHTDQIIDAIKKCWASYLSYQSVEYRRQNGQLIVEGMGVIIQEMVQSEVSGVMMTNDPLTGREDRIVVSSCVGLGDNVVSGKVDVDTFVIEARVNGDFKILQRTAGIKVNGPGCLGEENASQKNLTIENDCSLSDKWLNCICLVGKSIEMNFRKELEIEWAIEKEKLYILQARPITSGDAETNEDLFHEFDTPLGGERELLTTCNIQEMMPGATTPLTTPYFVDALNWGFFYINFYAQSGREKLNHPTGFIKSYGNSHFINILPLYVLAGNGFGGLKAKSFVEVEVLGEEIKESSSEDILNFKGTKLNTVGEFLKCTFSKLLFHDPSIKKEFHDFERIMQTYSIGKNSNDPQTLYQQIVLERFNLFQIWKIYFQLLANMPVSITKSILMGGLPNFTRENQEDMALLLTGSGAISSDVPKAITRLAKIIQSKGIANIFLESPDEEGMIILSKDEDIHKCLVEFMRDHGHRGIREAELMEKSWSQDPVKLIKALKSILLHGAFDRAYETDNRDFPITDAMKSLKTKLNPLGKWLIEKVLVPKARNKVLDRERGKSFVIKITEAFKKAYWSLADLMVREGRIPDEKLIFFLTHREIGELIATRSPRLIRKAKQRMKIYPLQQTTSYERISFGIPKVMNLTTESYEQQGISVIIEGQPIGNGEATGRVCVIIKEEDVSLIEKGDVLVCQYTDVGWSPYFPLIHGLVTEIGSILSHGAVVARECGIPCVVNVKNATKLLKTGDVVRINGSKGTVEKISAS